MDGVHIVYQVQSAGGPASLRCVVNPETGMAGRLSSTGAEGQRMNPLLFVPPDVAPVPTSGEQWRGRGAKHE